MSTNEQLGTRKSPGRPKIRWCEDLRVTVRLRYHCDQDLIQMLEKAPNKNDLIRQALRFWLEQAGGDGGHIGGR